MQLRWASLARSSRPRRHEVDGAGRPSYPRPRTLGVHGLLVSRKPGTTDDADEPSDDGRKPVRTLAELARLLSGKDDFQALVALTEDDPLRLEGRALDWVREHHLLLDRRKLVARSSTWLVAWGRGPVGHESLDELVAAAFASARDELLDEELAEARAARLDPALAEALSPRHAVLARRLGLRPDQVRFASAAMNDLPENERAALFTMLVQGEGFTHYAERMGITAREARDLLAAALFALSHRIREYTGDGTEDTDG